MYIDCFSRVAMVTSYGDSRWKDWAHKCTAPRAATLSHLNTLRTRFR